MNSLPKLALKKFYAFSNCLLYDFSPDANGTSLPEIIQSLTTNSIAPFDSHEDSSDL